MTNDICPTCGAQRKMWIHTLTPGLVSVLISAIQYVHTRNKNEFRLRDLDLTKSGYNNAQKLRFHALIAKIEDKPGHWCITARGGQFLRGEISVPLRVTTYRNRVVDHSPDLIRISSLKGIPYFEQQFAYETPLNAERKQEALI